MTQATGVGVLADLSRARRRHFVEKTDLINALYKAYMVGAALLVGGSILVGLAQSAPLGSRAQQSLVSSGPRYIGMALALAIFFGLRSGARGGPLALQGADIRMVLLSAVPRARFLRSRAVSQFRSAAISALLVGGLLGGVAHRALGGNLDRLVAEGALMALSLVLATLGSGYIGSGLRLNKWIAFVVGALFVLWSGSDLLRNTSIFPGTWLGQPIFHQSGFVQASLVFAAIISIFIVGLYFVPGLSLEMIERRARLVGTLRFAATTRDIRTVILLRRQLAGERVRGGRSLIDGVDFGSGVTAVLAKRSLESLFRWPIERFIRFVVLALVAGISARLMWSGSFLPLGVATVALFIAATDLLEPLSQLADRPEAIAGIGVARSNVESRLLLVPFLGMLVFVAIGTVATIFFSNFKLALHLALIGAIPLAAASTTGAAIAILRKQSLGTSASLMPEVVAITGVVYELIPFIVVGSGFLAMINGYNLHDLNTALVDSTAFSSASFSLLFPLAAWTWIRRRHEFSTHKV